MQRLLELLSGAILVKSQVPDETSSFRKSICDTCKKKDQDNICKVCGCFLAVKQKSKENTNPKKMRNEITHCPLGQWDDKEVANFYRELDGLPLLT